MLNTHHRHTPHTRARDKGTREREKLTKIQHAERRKFANLKKLNFACEKCVSNKAKKGCRHKWCVCVCAVRAESMGKVKMKNSKTSKQCINNKQLKSVLRQIVSELGCTGTCALRTTQMCLRISH